MIEDDASIDARMVHRFVFFSDAVFAIVLTLLVLELRPPASDVSIARGLTELVPHFAAFAGSFAVIAIFWAAHMAVTRRMVIFDWPTAWANLAFLFAIALTPFGSALVGERGATGAAWQFYCAIMIGASLTQTLLWLCLSRGGGRLINGVTWRERTFRTVRGLSTGIAFGVGFALVETQWNGYAVLCWVLILPIMGFASLLFGSKQAR